MNRTNYHSYDRIKLPLPVVIVFSFVLFLIGVIFCCIPNNDKPISKDEATYASGEFERFEQSKNYKEIFFSDGTSYSVYPHTVSDEFENKLKSIKKGTVLRLAVNPNNSFIVEIKTDTEEILNFEASQDAIYRCEKGYIFIGVAVCICSVLFLVITYYEGKAKHKDENKLKSIDYQR